MRAVTFAVPMIGLLAVLTACGPGGGAVPDAAAPTTGGSAVSATQPTEQPDPSSVALLGAAPAPASAAPTKPAVKRGCPRGAGLASVWASWPMPNPKSTGLPNPAAYTDLGNGTVRDNVTCLVWQKKAVSGYSWAKAKNYCAGLNLAGGGWHLPSRVELTTLVDTTRSGPAINTTAFPGTPVAFFWTSSPWVVKHSPAYAWIINFYEGLASNAGDQTGEYAVRCVRSPGGSGKPSYRIASGTVTDPRTGLIWQRASSAETMTAARATAYCKGLGLGGQAWRLPSVQELATTVDESVVAPAINRSAFPGTAKSTYYWSATASAAEKGKRWGLNYDDGYTNYRSISAGYARCVR